MLGSLGDIIFTVSTVKTLTFKDLTHSKSTKFHNHEIIGNKPITEFLNCDLDKITFSVELNKQLSVNIEETINLLDSYMNEGKPLDFAIGNKPFGADKWVIENMSTAYNIIFRNGFIHSVTVDLSLSEYISDISLQPNSTGVNISKLKQGIAFYSRAKNVVTTALSGGYNSYVKAEAFDKLLGTIQI